MDRIIVTGASGFVGSRMALHGALPCKEVVAPSHSEMDITDEKSVRDYVEKVRPQAIVHAAAISHMDVCEDNPEFSYRVNVKGPEYLARAARDTGAKLIFCSSDQVYNGCTGENPLKEDTLLSPVNVYGREKLEAEEKVLNLCPDGVCLRLTWMYDLPVRGRYTSPNLIMTLMKALVKNTPVQACSNDHRGITYVREVVENIPAMLRAQGGSYNYGSQSFVSSYETYRKLFALLGAEDRIETLLCPFKRKDSLNLLMDTEKAKQAGAVFSDTLSGAEKMLREYNIL